MKCNKNAFTYRVGQKRPQPCSLFTRGNAQGIPRDAFRVGNVIAYNKHRNAAQRLAKELRRRYHQRKVQDLRQSNPHSWWSSVMQFIGASGASGTQLNALCNSMFAGDVDLMANKINDFFANFACDLPLLSPDFLTNLDHSSNDEDDDSNFVISPSEVECALQTINIHKSPGPDVIPNWLLKDMAPLLANPICAIFNASIQQRSVLPFGNWPISFQCPKSIHLHLFKLIFVLFLSLLLCAKYLNRSLGVGYSRELVPSWIPSNSEHSGVALQAML
jgi:hypothetical protein